MTVTDIVITEFMDDAAVDSLRERYEVRYDPSLVDDRQTLLRSLGQAQALIVRNRTRVDVPLLEAAPRLRAVGRLGVGLDNIEVPACEHRSIAVLPATGANAVSVAEYVVTALLVLRRQHVFHATDRLLAGEWPRQELVGHELAGCRLALLGLGGIARLVLDRVRALDVEVVGLDPFVTFDDAVWGQVERAHTLPELLGRADALSIHVPLTAETHHILDADALALLPPHAVVVHTARGGILDEAALCDALRTGRLGGAALDVFEQEPPDAATLTRFAGVPNLVLTPHVAGVTVESNRAVSALVADRVREVLDATLDEGST
jgi:(S)-sulfolactate dehydrogenase